MRIISGTYKSRIIKTIKSLNTRPLTDRIKESIFNILVHRYSIFEYNILDLFAGSGSFGLEAISRGAAKVTFVEKSTESYNVLLENIKSLGCEKQCITYKMDVEQFIIKNNSEYDLIFCDPPFKLRNALEILNKIYDQNILKKDGILIYHSSNDQIFQGVKFNLINKKEFGRNIIYFLNQ